MTGARAAYIVVSAIMVAALVAYATVTVGTRNVMHPVGHFFWGIDFDLAYRLGQVKPGMTEGYVLAIVRQSPRRVISNRPIGISFGERKGTTLCDVNKAWYYHYGWDRSCYIVFDASGLVSDVVIGGM